MTNAARKQLNKAHDGGTKFRRSPDLLARKFSRSLKVGRNSLFRISVIKMALIDAAHNGDRSAVHELLLKVKASDSTSLELFVAEQQEEFNQLFKDWKHERSINQRDPVGDTPLHAAAARGDILMVRYLVSEGADVNAANNVCFYLHFLSHSN